MRSGVRTSWPRTLASLLLTLHKAVLPPRGRTPLKGAQVEVDPTGELSVVMVYIDIARRHATRELV